MLNAQVCGKSEWMEQHFDSGQVLTENKINCCAANEPLELPTCAAGPSGVRMNTEPDQQALQQLDQLFVVVVAESQRGSMRLTPRWRAACWRKACCRRRARSSPCCATASGGWRRSAAKRRRRCTARRVAARDQSRRYAGTNAVIQRHQEITEHFVPRSDLVLFVTSADRPFTESERASQNASATGARRLSWSSTRSIW